MAVICGIDEAGRGPVIGPLVMAGVAIEDKDEARLREIKVKDSKLLTREKRDFLYGKIIDIAKNYKILKIPPDEVDNAVNGNDGLNLNWLEARKSAEILNALKPGKAIIDAPSTNIPSYSNYLIRYIDDKKIIIILEHKADLNYPVVSAASILAKVTRDNEIDKLKEKIGIDFGSGYMSDPKTVKFLETHYLSHKELFRKSWMPYKEMIRKKKQKKLGDFTETVDKVEIKSKELVEKIKKLEDLGYKLIPVKTIYESYRLKGPCTVTFYKNGKMLIQGNEEDKKEIEIALDI